MFPAPELIAAESVYKQQRAEIPRRRRRRRPWRGVRRHAARRIGPTPQPSRPVVQA